MNYLGRPIYTFDIDWSAVVTRSITYDLRETSLGFGPEFFVPTAPNTAQGWSWTAQCKTNADIQALEDFTAALFGRLNGFWLPVPFETVRISAGIAPDQFKAVATNLAETWTDRPDIYLWFVSNDGTSTQPAKITAVVDNEDGTETITLNVNLNPAPAPGMFVRRLHYVRLLDDQEKGTFEAEGWLQREMAVVELPMEYTAVETGLQPIYLYQISAAAPVGVVWNFTSFAAPVWSNGVQYLPYPMTHGALQENSEATKYELQCEAKPDPAHPFSLFFPFPFGATMNLMVLKATLGDPDTTVTLFTGIVRNVDDQGSKYVANLASNLFLLTRKLPRWLLQPICNNVLFDANCGVIRAQYEVSVILAAIDNDPLGPNVTCTLAWPDIFPDRPHTANWFANGIFETGYGVEFEPRTILSSSWDSGASQLILTLNLPLQFAEVGQWCQITAGCDGQSTTCGGKFNNFLRFGGFIAIPQRNPSLEAFNNQPVSQGGKK